MNGEQFTVDKKIPLPPASYRGKYPFEIMKIGESFFIAEGDPRTMRVRSAASVFTRRHRDYIFVVRAVEGGVRIWRVESSPDSPMRKNGKGK